MRYRLQIPGTNGASAVREFVEQWIAHPAVRRLVEIDGGSWPTGTLEERVTALHEFSDRWDFRRGASERLGINEAALDLDTDELMALAGDLGLTGAGMPADTTYNHGVVLGGTAFANINRVKRLFELRERGVSVDASACLTALRELGEDERALVETRREIASLVAGAVTEFDVMVKAVTHFGGGAPEVSHTPNANPHLASARAQVGDTLVLAAPSADPGRRANTRDNYDVYRDRIATRQSILVVTSSIYLPYQFFVALQAIGWENAATVEAVGFPPDWMDGVLTGPRNVLQELRSAFYGARMTLAALGDHA
jgi:hypothetical protein